MWFTDASFMKGTSWAQWIFSQESRAFSWVDPATKSHNPGPGGKKNQSYLGQAMRSGAWATSLTFLSTEISAGPLSKLARKGQKAESSGMVETAPGQWTDAFLPDNNTHFLPLISAGGHGSSFSSSIPWELPATGHLHMLSLCLLFLISTNSGSCQFSDSSSKFIFSRTPPLAAKSEIAIYSPYPSPLPHSSQPP